MVNILIALRSQPVSLSWLLVLAAIYFVTYLRFVRNALQQALRVEGHIRRLSAGMLEAAVDALLLKLRLYRLVVGGLLLSFFSEVVCRSLFSSSEASTRTLLLFYELTCFLSLLLLAVSLRPRELSPFFYMLPLEELQMDISNELLDGEFASPVK